MYMLNTPNNKKKKQTYAINTDWNVDLRMIMLSERQKEYRWLLNNTGIICAES